jgi:hypothetical protein
MNSKAFKKHIRCFKPSEFSEWIGWGHPSLFLKLDRYRQILYAPVHPSPAPGALARFDEADSWHYCEKEGPTLSRACDVFPNCEPAYALTVALTCNLWGGIGIYFDTHYNGRKWIMLHLDTRTPGEGHQKRMTLLWIREQGEYLYPQYSEPAMRLLTRRLAESSGQRVSCAAR